MENQDSKSKNKIIFKNNINKKNKSKALFLDRDGVIIKDKHHVSDENNVELCQGAYNLIRYAFDANLSIIVITNQSGISKGLFSWDDYKKVTYRMLSLLGKPNPISAIYSNSYGNNAPSNSWRKPSPEMLFSAKNDLNINLKESLLIGDRICDLKAGCLAGVEKLFHVKSVHEIKEKDKLCKYIKNRNIFTCNGHNSKITFLDSLVDFPISSIEYKKR